MDRQLGFARSSSLADNYAVRKRSYQHTEAVCAFESLQFVPLVVGRVAGAGCSADLEGAREADRGQDWGKRR